MPDSPLPKLRFKFNAESDSHLWRVVTLHAREALSELYSVAVELACHDLGADPDALLGDKCEVLLSRDDHERAWRGVVHRVEHRGVAQGTSSAAPTSCPPSTASRSASTRSSFKT